MKTYYFLNHTLQTDNEGLCLMDGQAISQASFDKYISRLPASVTPDCV